MDYQLCFFTIFVSLFFIFLMRKHNTKNLPPGPWKLPFIGNMHLLLFGLPHHRLADLAKKYGPIMHLQLGQLSNVIISSPELAKEVLKTHDILFASRPFNLTASVVIYNSRDIAFSPYGEHWRQLRRICTLELLSAKRVQEFRSVMVEEVSKMIGSIGSGAGAPVNLSKMLTRLSFCITARTAIGKVFNEGDAFSSSIIKIICFLGGFNMADLFPSSKLIQIVSGMRSKLQKLHEEVDAVIEIIINEHRENRKSSSGEADDLVDVCLNLQDSNELGIPFTKEDIKAIILDMFIAGIDTSSATIEWVMSELLKNPKILRRAQAEVRQLFTGSEIVNDTRLENLTYLSLVIQETLRLHPPAPLLVPRLAGESVEIGGYNIPKNTGVFVNQYAISRDPNYWNEPERFYPERFLNNSINYKGNNFEYMPFGAGRRMCPGVLFGVAVVELVVANLLYHFDWTIPDDMKTQVFDMTEYFGIVVRRKHELLLTPVPYNLKG